MTSPPLEKTLYRLGEKGSFSLDGSALIVPKDISLSQMLEAWIRKEPSRSPKENEPSNTERPETKPETNIARCAVVLENRKPVGIFTKHNLLHLLQLAISGDRIEETTVDRVMTRSPVTVSQERANDLFFVLDLLQQHQIGCLPVIDENGDFVEAIAQTDVLNALERRVRSNAILVDRLQRQNKALRAKIQSQAARLEAQRQFIQNIPLAIVEWDANLQVKQWTGRAQSIFGWAARETISKGLESWQFVFEADIQAVRQKIDALLQHKATKNISYNRNYTKGGEILYCEWHNSAIFDERNNLVSILALAKDVTASATLERNLQAAGQQYASLATSSAVGIFRTDLEGNCIFTDRRWREIAEIDFEESLGRGWLQVLHPEDKDAVVDAWYRAARDKRSFQMEYRIQTPTGKIAWVAGQAAAESDDRGCTIGYVGTIADISDRKQVEKTLRDRDRQLREAQRIARFGSWELDWTHNRMAWSEELFRIFEVDTRQLKPSYTLLKSIVHPDDRTLVETAYTCSVRDRQPYDIEYRLLFSKGRVKHVQDRCETFYDEATGRPLRSVCTIQDITEQKQAEVTLHNLVNGTAAVTGENFFPELVRYLAEALGARYASVSQIGAASGANEHTFEILASWLDGRLQTAPRPIVGSNGELLEKLDWENYLYLSVMLCDAAGDRIGHLCVLHDCTIEDPQRARAILRAFAARAGAELERLQTARQIEALNAELEARVNLRTAEVKEREKQLQQSERDLRTLFNNVYDLIFVCTLDGTAIDVNERAIAFHQVGREEILGRSIADLSAPDISPDRVAELLQQVKAGESSIVEWKIQRARDGVVFDVEIAARAVSLGGREAIVASVRDIGDRKQMEKDLQLKQFMLDRAGDSIFFIGPNGRLVYANEAACRSLEYSLEELLQLSAFDIDPRLSSERWPDFWQEMRQKRVATLESLHRTKGDREFPIEIGLNWIEFDGQEYICAAARDITERKQTERHLLESKKLLQLILDNIPQRIFWKDRESRYLGCNRAFAKDAGLESPEEIAGKVDIDLPWVDIDLPSNEKFLLSRAEDESVMRTNTAKLHVEELQQRKDGTLLWLRTSKIPLHDADGKAIGVVGSYEDITDRKQAEERIRESEARFRAIFEQAAIGIAQVTLDGYVFNPNQTLCDLLGYAPTELSGKHVIDISHLEDINPHVLHDLIHGKLQSYTQEKRFFKKDGSTLWTQVGVSLVCTPAGEPHYLVKTCQDISDRKAAEEALKLAQFALDKADDAIFFIGRNGRLFYANDAACKRLGYTREEFSNLTIQDIAPEFLPGIWRAHWADLQTCKVLTFETRYQTWDGQEIPVEVSANYLEFNNTEYNCAIARDIRDRQEAQNLLLESERYHRNLLDRLAIGLALRRTNGSLVYANQAYADLIGRTPDEAMNLSYQDITPAEYADREAMQIESLQKKGFYGPYEKEYIHADGRRIPVRLSGVLVEKDGEQFIWSSVDDISDIKEIERDLKHAKEAAEVANRAKSEFLALMSHEIRTPMSAIIGLNHLALQTQLTFKQKDYLSKIQNAARSLLQIINDILDFSKIEAEKLTLEKSDFRLADVLENLANIVGFQAEEKGLKLLFQFANNIPNFLIGDSLRLEQVLLNLTGNAVKFTERGEIQVFVEKIARTEDLVRLKFSVRDTGIGLTREQIGKLFQSFSQVDSSARRRYSGTGLGLAICKRLVEMMNGRIWVESEPERGSNFQFEVELGWKNERTNAARKNISNLQGLKCLIVDSNSTTRERLQEALESFSFQVTSVESRREAVEELNRTPASASYKLVFVDFCGLETNGINAIRYIKICTQTTALPYILTGADRNFEEIEQLAAQAGIEAILFEPFERSKLFEVILEVFDRACLTHQLSCSIARSTTDRLQDLHAVRGAKILLAEDNEINQQIARELLEKVGVRVEIANNGCEAIAKVRDDNFDLILMDIRMPKMDGLMAAQKIRSMATTEDAAEERFASIPIVAMTAHAMNGDREKSLAAGMNDHITKPVDPNELYATLVRWIEPKKREDISSPVQFSATAPPAEKTSEQSPNLPESMAGIDIKEGLLRVAGNADVYRRILKKFRKDFQGFMEKLQDAILQDGNFDRAASFVHTIKGVAGNIGANPLFQASSDLEKALTVEQIEHLPMSLEAFARSLEEVLVAIATLEPLEPLESSEDPSAKSIESFPDKAPNKDIDSEVLQPNSSKHMTDRNIDEEIDRDKILDLLCEIAALLDSDLVEAGDRLEVLKQHVASSWLEAAVRQLEKYLEIFDTDSALYSIQKIANMLDPS